MGVSLETVTEINGLEIVLKIRKEEWKIESLPFTKGYWRISFRIAFEESGSTVNFEKIVLFINIQMQL